MNASKSNFRMHKLSAIILAGGKSSRMGFDKQRIQLENGTYLSHEICGASSLLFAEVIIVTNTPEFYENLPVKTVQDQYQEAGPLAGIHAGLMAAKHDYSYVLACDMPEIDVDYIDELTNYLDNSIDGVVIYNDDHRYEPFQAFYHRRLVGVIEKHIEANEYQMQALIKQANFKELSLDALRSKSDPKLFENLNTQTQLNDYLKTRGATE